MTGNTSWDQWAEQTAAGLAEQNEVRAGVITAMERYVQCFGNAEAIDELANQLTMLADREQIIGIVADLRALADRTRDAE